MINGLSIIPGGLHIDFFPSDKFEVMDSKTNTEVYARAIARNVLRVLMMGWPKEGLNDLALWDVFNAVFVERDPRLVRGMRYVFQEAFHHIYEQLKDKTLNESQQAQAMLYLSDCLCILPFGDITPHESIAIPQCIDGKWVLVDYKVVPIELTPQTGIDKAYLAEKDRVFAYGLEPIKHKGAEPHLIFMGTTYPSGQGFSTQLFTDLEGFETAGKKLYRSGHERIKQWLDKQSKKTHVCGTSLGGSLSLLLAIDQGEKLSRVDALNPFGLYNPWRKSRCDHWDELCAAKRAPPVYIQKQGRDPISSFGIWKKEWNVFHVIPPEHRQGPNASADHALIYAGFLGTRFIPVDVEADNKARRLRDFLGYVLLRSMVHYGIMLAYHYVLQPILRYALNHWPQTSLVVGAFLFAAYLPSVVLAAMLVFAMCMAVHDLFYIVKDVMSILRGTNVVNPPAFHTKNALKNESLNIYTNETTTTFTVKELSAYYEAKAYSKHHTFFTVKDDILGGLSRDEILEKSQSPALLDELIEVTASKAKIHHITRTLDLLAHQGKQERPAMLDEQEKQCREAYLPV